VPLVGIDDSPDVVAVVPTMGLAPERFAACVESMIDSSGPARLAILVILNSSTVDPVTLERKEIRVVTAGVNLGWAGGLNFGASQSNSNYIWWMQDDVVVEASSLAFLFEALEADLALACASPLSVTDGGNVVAGSCGGIIAPNGALDHWLPEQNCAPHLLPDLAVLSYLPSRGLLVRRTAFDIANGLDSRLYPAQFVDVDFGFRLKEHGLSGTTVRESTIRHSGSASTPLLFAQFLHSRNAQTFRASWFPNVAPPPERFFPVEQFRPDDAAAVRHPVNSALAPELLVSTAQSASDALSHLGRVFTQTMLDAAERLRESKAELERASSELRAETLELQDRIDALQSSRSWRVTSPLRRISDLLKRRARTGKASGDQ